MSRREEFVWPPRCFPTNARPRHEGSGDRGDGVKTRNQRLQCSVSQLIIVVCLLIYLCIPFLFAYSLYSECYVSYILLKFIVIVIVIKKDY